MIFPIGDDQVKGGHKPILAYGLIAINVLVFLYESQLSNAALGQLFYEFGAIPSLIFNGDQLYTLMTNMFLHSGIKHLLWNMLFLWIFADNIEAIIGSLPFLGFYLIGGVAASLIHAAIDPSSTLPAVGASGAIAAVMGAYLIMFPKSRIKMIFLIIFRPFHIPAIIFLGIWIAQQLISGFTPAEPGSEGARVAWWAHIGGFVYGVVVGYFIKKFHPYEYHQQNYHAREK